MTITFTCSQTHARRARHRRSARPPPPSPKTSSARRHPADDRPSASTAARSKPRSISSQAQNGDKAGGKKVEVIVRRHGRRRHHQAPGAGTRRQRQGSPPSPASASRRWRSPPRPSPPRPRSPRSSWPPARRSSPILALRRAHQFHAAAEHDADRPMGAEEQHQEGRDARDRLRSGPRRGKRPSSTRSKAGGGQVLDRCALPLRNPEFAPFLQKART